MTTLRIIGRILGRIVSFGFGGAFVCALIGVVEGGAFGALLGAIGSLTGPASSLARGFVSNLSEVLMIASIGAQIGAGFGAIAGGICGALSFAILGGFLRPRSNEGAAFRAACRGAFWCALFGASGAAISGAIAWPLMQFLRWNIGLEHFPTLLQAAFAPFNGGFFCGSIAGFVLGCFGGALHGGLTLKPIAPRALMRRLRSSRPDNPRPDAEPQIV